METPPQLGLEMPTAEIKADNGILAIGIVAAAMIVILIKPPDITLTQEQSQSQQQGTPSGSSGNPLISSSRVFGAAMNPTSAGYDPGISDAVWYDPYTWGNDAAQSAASNLGSAVAPSGSSATPWVAVAVIAGSVALLGVALLLKF